MARKKTKKTPVRQVLYELVALGVITKDALIEDLLNAISETALRKMAKAHGYLEDYERQDDDYGDY